MLSFGDRHGAHIAEGSCRMTWSRTTGGTDRVVDALTAMDRRPAGIERSGWRSVSIRWPGRPGESRFHRTRRLNVEALEHVAPQSVHLGLTRNTAAHCFRLASSWTMSTCSEPWQGLSSEVYLRTSASCRFFVWCSQTPLFHSKFLHEVDLDSGLWTL